MWLLLIPALYLYLGYRKTRKLFADIDQEQHNLRIAVESDIHYGEFEGSLILVYSVFILAWPFIHKITKEI